MTTRPKLPPQAAAVLDAIAKQNACDVSDLELLRALLLPKTLKLKSKPIRNGEQRALGGVSKTKGKATKENAVRSLAVHKSEPSLAEIPNLQPSAKLRLATEVLNAVLQILTSEVKRQNAERRESPQARRRDAFATASKDSERKRPLQPLNLNQVLIDSSKDKLPVCKSSQMPQDATRNRAESARVALSCLRIFQSTQGFKAKFSSFQLESAMGALISKCIALGLDDLALKEMRILKRRIDQLCQPSYEIQSLEQDSKALDRTFRRDLGETSLPALLRFQVQESPIPVLLMVVNLQVQCLKILAKSGPFRAIEIAMQDLRTNEEHSPTALLKRLVDTQLKDCVDEATRQYESLIVAFQQLQSVVLDENDASALTSSRRHHHVLFELSLITVESHFHWRKLGNQSLDLEKQLVQPLTGAIRILRKSQTEPREILELAEGAYRIMRVNALDNQDAREAVDITQITKNLGELAAEAGQLAQAVHWTRLGLENIAQLADPVAKRPIFLCRLASLHLQQSASSIEESTDTQILRDANHSLAESLLCEQGVLDELMIEVSTVAKHAVAFVQRHYKSFEPSVLAAESSRLGQCLHLALSCAVFLMRYVRHRKDPNAVAEGVMHVNGQMEKANQTAAFLIPSIITIARLGITADSNTWRVFESGIRRCIEISQALEETGLGQTRHVAISDTHVAGSLRVYWSRFLWLSKSSHQHEDARVTVAESLGLLRRQPTRVKAELEFPEKLEKAALFCETRGDLRQARSYLEEAIEFLIETDVLKKWSERCFFEPAHASIRTDGRIRLLNGLLYTLIRIWRKPEGHQTEVSKFLDQPSLLPQERALLLQRQLDAMIDSVSHDGHSAIFNSAVEELLLSLFSIYDAGPFHVQRLHVSIRVHSLLLLHPNARLKALVNGAFRQATQHATVEDHAEGQGLYPYANHLIAMSRIYIVLASANPAESAIGHVLAEWCTMAQSGKEVDEMAKDVYSVEDWIILLESLADFCLMNRYDAWRVATLFILAYIRPAAVDPESQGLISALQELAFQYAFLGYSAQADSMLLQAEQHMNEDRAPSVLSIRWYLRKANHSLVCGRLNHSLELLQKARQQIHDLSNAKDNSTTQHERHHVQAYFMLIASKISLAQRLNEDALYAAKLSVNLYRRLWATIEPSKPSQSDTRYTENQTSALTTSLAIMSMSQGNKSPEESVKDGKPATKMAWVIGCELYDSLTHLALLLVDSGLVQDSRYYLEQGHKIARTLQSSRLVTSSLALLDRLTVQSGDLESLSNGPTEVEQLLPDTDLTYTDLLQGHVVAETLVARGHVSAAKVLSMKLLHRANELSTPSALHALLFQSHPPAIQNPRQNQEPKSNPRASKTTKSKLEPNKVAKGPRSGRMRSPEPTSLDGTGVMPLTKLKADLFGLLAYAASFESLLDEALAHLDEETALPVPGRNHLKPSLLRAKVSMGQASNILNRDLIFSIAAESAICYPAKTIASVSDSSLKATQKPSRSAKAMQGKRSTAKSSSADNVSVEHDLDPLYSTLKNLEGLRPYIFQSGSTSMSHIITGLMGELLIKLSILPTGLVKPLPLRHLTWNLEIGKYQATKRQLEVINVDRILPTRVNSWAEFLQTSNKASDLSQSEFDVCSVEALESSINKLPASWLIINLTLSESKDALWVSKIRPGQRPFSLRLPFDRESVADCEDQSFGFDQGKNEMRDIIREANDSAHNNGDMVRKGAKTAWWDRRVDLNRRLQDLLTNMQNVWLGGFRGVFSDHVASKFFLARFGETFQVILNKYLPSRQKCSKAQQECGVRLDAGVLNLFVGLGNPSEADVDLDDQLQDLLYFVVDILQFNGERNACDEIDFDAMAIDTLNALQQYHQSIIEDLSELGEVRHTILVLDKQLHCFPWESLPCLSGRSISRLTSLACLAPRWQACKARSEAPKQSATSQDGLVVDACKGTYILNPSGDLMKTQAILEESLKTLEGWGSYVQKEPTEVEMIQSLQSSDIFLYFGHGSGGQYIRSRSIKQLEKCAVALLMGCSSGTLTEAGELEPYGTPVNYLHANCPALVANLWDVTDKDIDCFSETVLENWGLFKVKREVSPSNSTKTPSKPRRKDKGKEGANGAEIQKQNRHTPASLDEAVARSRDSCFLRYLNGAAPVVYGIPVYIS